MLDYYIGTEAEIPEFSAYPEIRAQDVRRSSVKRYSGTQDSHMTLRGIKGKAVFGSMPDECLDYLIAGELIHIGRNTSFGFGNTFSEEKGAGIRNCRRGAACSLQGRSGRGLRTFPLRILL